MKRLLLLPLLLALSVGAETVQELEAWVSRTLTSNELALASFEVPATIRGGEHVLVCTAFGVTSPANTNAIIPEAACDQVYGAGAVTNLPLHDFSLVCQIVDTNLVFMLSANYVVGPPPYNRGDYTTADDVMQWLEFTGPYGVTISNIITVAQYKALIVPE
jgi:hypothetical protein